MRSLTFLTLVSNLAACALETETPRPKEVPSPSAPVAEFAMPTEVSLIDTMAYEPSGKRDPFRSTFEEAPVDVAITPLQEFDIDQLRVAGIALHNARPVALIEDPTNFGHTVSVGTLLGKRWGRVTSIKGRCVVVREDYRDTRGRKIANVSELCIPPDEPLRHGKRS